MKILPFHSARGCYSYLLVVGTEAALIDASEEIADAEYLSALSSNGAKLAYLIETHTHADHISSAPRLREATGAKLVRHKNAPSALKDVAVTGGETLALGEETLQFLFTPGHTNESISVVTNGAVFTGDALLIGGTGRTDFQLGDSEALYNTLHSVLGALPNDTRVYPAHEYKGRAFTTLAEEKEKNARYQLSHEKFVEEMNAHHPEKPELFEKAIEVNSK